jgi:hypothetical protein
MTCHKMLISLCMLRLSCQSMGFIGAYLSNKSEVAIGTSAILVIHIIWCA